MRPVKDTPAPMPEALPAPVTDSHTHLDTTAEYTGLAVDDLLQRAGSVGVTRTVQVGCDVESSRWALELAAREPSVVATVALHPNDAARLAERAGRAGLDEALREIETLAGDPRPDVVRAVGETGLDYYRTSEGRGRSAQREAFAAHLAIAARHGRTVVVHDRDAHRPIVEILDAEGVPDRLVMHCFSGDAADARMFLDRGAWLSFPGTVTFPANEALREAFDVAPLDRVLVESDAPFLTPVPRRGWPNASYLVPHTVRFLAERRGIAIAELCAVLVQNTHDAFGGSWPARSAGPDPAR
ncbi:TatD family hydrolase [Raineyella sp.]|uniref:Putative metal-dependent hydrolase TatD n=1 Tax=bioreactor metagenome TaxID=1076179 RepID=A0A644ZAN1_9ZZZZ|nr:TatD family hydrolase [Raineyella sp.]MEA5154438.1 TatD family hydrolase [Raineyella sp.]